MKAGSFGFAKLFKDAKFNAKIIAVVFDEAHCISQWGSFRPEFREIGRLRHILRGVPLHIASATLPDHVQRDVIKTMNINRSQMYITHRSNDRPNVFIAVRELKHSMSSYADLDFLVADWAAGKGRPRKFLVVFDSILDSVLAGLHLRSLLPRHLRNKVKWHNSNMSAKFRAEEIDAFLRGEILGFCATDTLGMVSFYIRI